LWMSGKSICRKAGGFRESLLAEPARRYAA
jgi:hypothetical protein